MVRNWKKYITKEENGNGDLELDAVYATEEKMSVSYKTVQPLESLKSENSYRDSLKNHIYIKKGWESSVCQEKRINSSKEISVESLKNISNDIDSKKMKNIMNFSQTSKIKKKSKKGKKPDQEPSESYNLLIDIYLSTFGHQKDAWKFSNLMQKRIIKNLLNMSAIPTKLNILLADYVSSMQGNARERVRDILQSQNKDTLELQVRKRYDLLTECFI